MNQELKIKVKYLKTFFERSKGLIGISKPYAICFKTRFGIHTFGLRFPIDVVILDKNNTAVVLKSNLKPNSLFFWNPKYTTVLELPNKTILQKKLSKGAKVRLLS